MKSKAWGESMEHLKPEDSIVILTGAGISKESGLDTFRDAGGVWSCFRLEDVATPEGFARDPGQVHQFYNDRRRGLADPAVVPNPAHEALVRLEQTWPGDVLLVTQNIDDLHGRAGSRNLIHMHGELLKVRCGKCQTIIEHREDLTLEDACAACGITGRMRPHVVWFGEMPLEMERIFEALQRCGLFMSVGTSGNVYPAAGFVQQAYFGGAHTVELNLEPSSGATLFHDCRHGPATQVVPAFVDELLARL